MSPLLLTLSAIMLFALAGWGQTSSRRQANASVAAHKREAKEHAARHHREHHHRKHRRHGKA